MKWPSSTLSIVQMEQSLEESKNERDARVEKLWRKLDPLNAGELDFKGLQKGLRRIDHPMKNANAMTKSILERLDTDKDGKIQYSEFRAFIQQAESQLLQLFRSIDQDKNGRLERRELQSAFRKAGIVVSSRKLDNFFNDLDVNHDGSISFEEWRDFLLFMPINNSGSPLKAAMTFYTSIVTVNSEGDSIVEGDGTHNSLERGGTMYAVGQTRECPDRTSAEDAVGYGSAGKSRMTPAPPPPSPPTATLRHSLSRASVVSPLPGLQDESSPVSALARRPDARSVPLPGSASVLSHIEPVMPSSLSANVSSLVDADMDQSLGPLEHVVCTTAQRPSPALSPSQSEPSGIQSPEGLGSGETRVKGLTSFIPDPGYFLAGAIAGGVSRTATAPLDRLKVFLLVNTKSGPEIVGGATAAGAVKQGRPVSALQKSLAPIRHAIREIHSHGGMRGFFAGNGLNVIKIMPETAIKFGAYEAAKRALANIEGHGDARAISPYSKFAAGGIAGMMAQFCVYPLDTLKFRLQCETVRGGLTGNALVMATARKMFAEGMMRTAYRGVTMGLIGMFPYSAIDMGTFELLKTAYTKYYAQYTGCHEEDAGPGNLATGIIGAGSGAFGASVVYPLNVVRTRLQTQGTVMHRATYTGVVDATRKTIQNEGFRGLYKGLTPNLLKVAPALSITWVVYENAKKALHLE